MSFSMTTEETKLDTVDQAHACLEAWAAQITDTESGSMSVTRNGEIVEIKVSKKFPPKEWDLKFAEIHIHHTYKYIYELAMGLPEESKHFSADITGLDPDAKSISLHFYINHTSEDRTPWFKSFSCYTRG